MYKNISIFSVHGKIRERKEPAGQIGSGLRDVPVQRYSTGLSSLGECEKKLL
jgi:hypothetical protein